MVKYNIYINIKINMQRFFLPLSSKIENKILINDEDTVHQLEHVLRYAPGSEIICLFNDHQEHIVKLTNFSKKEIKWEIIKTYNNKNEIPFNLVLFLALPKSKATWELIVQKSVELWVKEIIPMKSSRVYAQYETINDRTKKIIKEASEQSERSILLNIKDTINYNSSFENFDKVYIADSYNKNIESLATTTDKHIIQEQMRQYNIWLIIGPEWGFSEQEIKTMCNNGATPVSLWKRILRTETAAIVWLAILNN